MSNLVVNTITPHSTSKVDFEGLEVPSYLGAPLVVEPGADTYFPSTELSGKVTDIVHALELALNLASGTSGLTLNQLMARVRVPTGTVTYGYYASAPPGTLFLHGLVYNRADYPALYALAVSAGLIVTDAVWNTGSNDKGMFSSGDGTTTFRVPDIRGRFIRCINTSASGIDLGRTLGSVQTDALQDITGTLGIITGGGPGTGAFAVDGAHVNHLNSGVAGTEPGITFDASRVARTSTETRPTNVALSFCIYY